MQSEVHVSWLRSVNPCKTKYPQRRTGSNRNTFRRRVGRVARNRPSSCNHTRPELPRAPDIRPCCRTWWLCESLPGLPCNRPKSLSAIYLSQEWSSPYYPTFYLASFFPVIHLTKNQV